MLLSQPHPYDYYFLYLHLDSKSPIFFSVTAEGNFIGFENLLTDCTLLDIDYVHTRLCNTYFIDMNYIQIIYHHKFYFSRYKINLMSINREVEIPFTLNKGGEYRNTSSDISLDIISFFGNHRFISSTTTLTQQKLHIVSLYKFEEKKRHVSIVEIYFRR